jgi:hypothetical protein
VRPGLPAPAAERGDRERDGESERGEGERETKRVRQVRERGRHRDGGSEGATRETEGKEREPMWVKR